MELMRGIEDRTSVCRQNQESRHVRSSADGYRFGPNYGNSYGSTNGNEDASTNYAVANAAAHDAVPCLDAALG